MLNVTIPDAAAEAFEEYALSVGRAGVDPYDLNKYSLLNTTALSGQNSTPLLHHMIGEKMAEIFPSDVVGALRMLRAGKHEKGSPVVVVNNVPIDRMLPVTPPNRTRAADKGIVSELALIGMGGLANLGPTIDEDARDRDPIQQLSDERATTNLALHTENSFRVSEPPYALGLLGLRGGQTPTSFVAMQDVLDVIPSQLQGELYKAHFKMASVPKKLCDAHAFPIVSVDKHGNKNLRLTLFEGRLEGTTDEAKRIVSILQERFGRHDQVDNMYIGPRMAVFWVNGEHLHGRLLPPDVLAQDVDKPRVQEDRWVQRAMFGSPVTGVCI